MRWFLRYEATGAMSVNKEYEMEDDLKEIPSTRPGDKVLRRSRKKRRKLRAIPDIPVIFRVFEDIFTKTPFLPMFLTLVVLWLLFAFGMYLVERNAIGAAMTSYGESLWWALASVETMGTPYEPATTGGHIIGGIWAVLGVMVFWGTIIASVTVYFTNRRNSHSSRIIETIHYDLDELEKLTLDELEAVKSSTARIIDNQIQALMNTAKNKSRTSTN